MLRNVRQLTTMAGLTFLETVRQPISLVLTTTCLLFILLMPYVITHTLDTAAKLVRDSALAVHLLTGLLLAGYSACSSIAREIRSGTASTILSKPVQRDTFLLAKFLGVALLLLCFSVSATLCTLVSTRVAALYDARYQFDTLASLPAFAAVAVAYLYGGVVNYTARRPFISQAYLALLLLTALGAVVIAARSPEGAWSLTLAHLPWDVAPAGLLVTLAVFLLAAFAVTLATRLDVAPTLCICGAVLLLGLISDYLFGRAAAHGSLPGRVFYALVPNWQHFWTADLLAQDQPLTLRYVAQASLYALLYGSGLLLAGMWIFRRMELR